MIFFKKSKIFFYDSIHMLEESYTSEVNICSSPQERVSTLSSRCLQQHLVLITICVVFFHAYTPMIFNVQFIVREF